MTRSPHRFVGRPLHTFMLNTLIADLRSPDPLVRVKAPPRLGDLGAAAIKAIPALLSLTQDETQHPMIKV